MFSLFIIYMWICCALDLHFLLLLAGILVSFSSQWVDTVSLCNYQGRGLFSFSDFRCQATSLSFTFPSFGHVTRVWLEPASMTRNTHRRPFLLFSHSSRFRYLIRYSFIIPSRTLGLVGPHLLPNFNSLGFFTVYLWYYFELVFWVNH